MATEFQKKARFKGTLLGLFDDFIETNFPLEMNYSMVVGRKGGSINDDLLEQNSKGNAFSDWHKIEGLASWELADRYRIKYRIGKLFDADQVKRQIKEKWLPGEIEWERPELPNASTESEQAPTENERD